MYLNKDIQKKTNQGKNNQKIIPICEQKSKKILSY